MENGKELNELEALRFAARAQRSITTLEIARKAVTTEYSERIKQLRSLVLMFQQSETLGQLSLHGVDAVEVSPEVKKLVYDPLGGLK